ncbi:3-dehydroquinate dehydratase [Brevibacillus sp. HD3.3A]|nr:3-dehydroquinate dehydratase [Brevibacillus sp. HD3.3A]
MINDMKIAIVNGPNMNLLGLRETGIYGTVTWKQIEDRLNKLAGEWQVDVLFFQSNHEGEIVDFIQQQLHALDGVVINPAGFSKTGYSILDALTAVGIPYVEVHMSNIFERGGWHAESIFFANAVGHVIGLKANVYELGLRGIMQHVKEQRTSISGKEWRTGAH